MEIWIESRRTYGCPRIHAALSAEGVRVSRKRVARLMRELGIEGVTRRRFRKGTTKRDADAEPAPDLVNRDFSAGGPNRLWVADITQVPTEAGWLHLAWCSTRGAVGSSAVQRVSAAVISKRLISAVLCIVSSGLIVACAVDELPLGQSFDRSCHLETSEAVCDSCIAFRHVAQLGADWMGPGHLNNDGTMEYVARDGSGNYWVGQSTELKRYAPDGQFLGVVGRPGEGPLEFGHVTPIHVDAGGRVHVLDAMRGRISIIGQETLQLESELTLQSVSVNSAVAINDGEQYAIQAWIPTAEQIGLPIHIINDQGLVRSFGIDQIAGADEMTQHTPQTTERRLDVDQQGVIYAAHRYEYIVEG